MTTDHTAAKAAEAAGPKLIDRLRLASGPDRVLDALIDIACDQSRPEWARDTGTLTADGQYVRITPTGPGWNPPLYTDSIDVALTIIPAGLYWVAGFGKTRPEEAIAGAQIFQTGDDLNPIGEAEGPTVAIAICIAALEARANG